MAQGAGTGLPTWAENRHPRRLKSGKNLRRFLARAMQLKDITMRGFITEQHFEQAEIEFPGIRAVYLACPCDERPRTFVELLARYLRAVAVASVSSQPRPA